MEYAKWNYSYDKEKGYKVIPNFDATLPKTFFKYYGLNENSVDALTNMYLFATHPSLFNDPFDCNKKLIKFRTEDDVKNLWGSLYSDLKEKMGYDMDRMLDYSQETYMNVLYRKLGIVSLTNSNDNLLMWAHYANHTGFCVEYDMDKLGIEHYGPFPINYADEINTIGIDDIGGHLAMLIQTNVKSPCWKYENEYRLLIPGPKDRYLKGYGECAEELSFPDDHDRKFSYSMMAIQSICLGYKFFAENIYNITDCELEVSYNDKERLDFKVLDFLSNSKLSHIDVFQLQIKGLSEMDIIPISVCKISGNKFRINKYAK